MSRTVVQLGCKKWWGIFCW